MIIPKGVDFGQFYRNARAKGVKIASRFRNVYIWHGHESDSLFWSASVGMSKKDPKYFRKTFPFTEKGEEMAAQAVMEHKIKFGIKSRIFKNQI